MEKIKNYQDQISNKIQTENNRNDDYERFLLKKKGENKWAYEHVFFLEILVLNILKSDAGWEMKCFREETNIYGLNYRLNEKFSFPNNFLNLNQKQLQYLSLF